MAPHQTLYFNALGLLVLEHYPASFNECSGMGASGYDYIHMVEPEII